MKRVFTYVSGLMLVIGVATTHVYSSECDTAMIFGRQTITCSEGHCPSESSSVVFEDGILRRERIYFSCQDSGMFLFFSEKGDTLTKSFFKGRNTVGVMQQWHPNGQPNVLARYNNAGKKDGLSETWREDGTRKDSTVYDNGEIIEIREYYTTGQVRYWAEYPDGTWRNAKMFTPDGKPCGQIEDGNGSVILYTDDGSRRYLRTYAGGKRVESRELKPDEHPSLR